MRASWQLINEANIETCPTNTPWLQGCQIEALAQAGGLLSCSAALYSATSWQAITMSALARGFHKRGRGCALAQCEEDQSAKLSATSGQASAACALAGRLHKQCRGCSLAQAQSACRQLLCPSHQLLQPLLRMPLVGHEA